MNPGQISILLLFSLLFTFTACKESDNSSQEIAIQTTGNPAVDHLSTQIKKNPENPELFYQRSIAYANMEAFDNAIDDMYKAMNIDSLQPKYYVHLADMFVNYYRSKQAVQVLRLASERFPENINLQLKYAELLLTVKQNQQAVQTIQRVLDLDRENAEAFFLMGLLMQEEGDIKRAKGAFKRVVEINPEVTDAYILLGELYEEENPKLSLQYLDNAITVDPENINALHSKAFFLQNHDDINGALELYRKINILDPNYSPAFLNAGILYYEIGELEKAFEQFNILVGIEPTNHLGYFYRGVVYKEQGDFKKAKMDFEQSLVYKEDYKNAKDQLILLKAESLE